MLTVESLEPRRRSTVDFGCWNCFHSHCSLHQMVAQLLCLVNDPQFGCSVHWLQTHFRWEESDYFLGHLHLPTPFPEYRVHMTILKFRHSCCFATKRTSLADESTKFLKISQTSKKVEIEIKQPAMSLSLQPDYSPENR